MRVKTKCRMGNLCAIRKGDGEREKNCYYNTREVKTNADRIRAMTDEELAEFLDRWEMGDIDYSKTFCDLCKGQLDCHNDCLMGWLKQEVTND